MTSGLWKKHNTLCFSLLSVPPFPCFSRYATLSGRKERAVLLFPCFSRYAALSGRKERAVLLFPSFSDATDFGLGRKQFPLSEFYC
jgi:hypothetical protein